MITHNLNAMSKRLMALPKTIEKNATDMVRKAAIGICTNVILPTPHDTGLARANWQVGIGNPIFTEVQDTDYHGRETLAEARARIIVFQRRDGAIHITNNLPYINRLNEGWSDQRSAGYIERAIEGVHAKINQMSLLKRI